MTIKTMIASPAYAAGRPVTLAEAKRIDETAIVYFGPDVPPVLRFTTPVARRFFQVCVAMVADSVTVANLTPLQYGTLSYISRQGGEPGVDQNSLAGRLGVDRNNASLIVDQLAERGLIERRVNGADRRARQLYLTPKGEKLFTTLRPKNIASNARILEPLAPHERKLLIDMLIRIIAAHGANARPGAGRRKRGSGPSASDRSRPRPTQQNRGDRHV